LDGRGTLKGLHDPLAGADGSPDLFDADRLAAKPLGLAIQLGKLLRKDVKDGGADFVAHGSVPLG
jgi:hypothetical protein